MKAYAPGLGFYHDFLPQGQGFCTFFVPRGVGNLPIQKNSPGFGLGRGDGQAWN